MKLYNSLLKQCSFDSCLLVTYSNLKKDMIQTMEKVLKFLGYSITNDITTCLTQFSEGSFKSQKRPRKEIRSIHKTISKEKIGINLSAIYKQYVNKFIDILYPHP